MISLCVITNTIDIGGAETQLLRLVGRLDPEKIRITVVYYGGRGDLVDEFERSPAQLVFLDRGRIGRLRFVPRLAQFIRRNRFDLVHCWRGTANHYGALAAILARSNCILTGHRDFYAVPLQTRLIDLCLRPFVRLRVVNSEAIKRKHAQAAWLPERHLRVLYNGIDPREFEQQESPAAIRRSVGLDPRRPLLTIVGRLDAPKRQELFLALAERLTRTDHDLSYALLGDGPDRTLLEERIRASGLGDRAKLLGNRRDVARLLHATTLSICTSVHEGLPNAVLESMMAGTPVITVDNGGGPELVQNSEQVVPTDDLEALASKVAQALGDPAQLEAWQLRGKRRALDVFTIDAAAKNYMDLLVEQLGRSERDPALGDAGSDD